MGFPGLLTDTYEHIRQRGPGAEAENLLAFGCATEAANLPHSVRTLTLSK